MPFTLAHPAAVLPIRAKLKQWISLPALVAGSMVPDAAYYLPLPADYKEKAHALLGLFSFCLPVGLALLSIFYWVAPELALLLPSPHREALQPGIAGGSETKTPAPFWRRALLAACCVVLGAVTHLVWDSFTHNAGWAVLRFSFLRARIWRGVLLYDALEYLSSLAGLYIVLYFVERWMKARGASLWTPPRPSWRLYLWLGVLAACFAEALLESRTLWAVATLYFLHSRHFGLILVTSFIRNVLIALVALPVMVKALRLIRGSRLRDAAY